MSRKILISVIASFVFVLFVFLFIWFGCRIEPKNGEIAVLIRKTGKELAPEDIIAISQEYKGIQLNVLGEGRYFYNPYSWDWLIMPITDVPAGKFAVLIRKFGTDLPNGKILAESDNSKGVLSEVLGTGKHRINPYAYEVRIYDDIKIMPGNIGIVTAISGEDIFSGHSNDFSFEDGFLVKEGNKGVMSKVLKEGTHRLNPFIYSVTSSNIQSQRHEFSGKDSVTFLTIDGFNISLEGTVEFKIDEKMAPRLAHEVGNMEDIINKLILPSFRGFSRIEGSKKSATEFIVGESRRIFQERLDSYLKENCKKWGIIINSVLIRDIIVPEEIAEIIRNRELAQQEVRKYNQQIEQARSEAELQRQKMLADQNSQKVAAETMKLTAIIQAQQAQMERRITAETQLKTATIEFQTATAKSKALLITAEAEKDIITTQNRNEAEVLKRQIEAYGSGDAYLKGMLYRKIMPGLSHITVNSAESSVFGLPLNINAKKNESEGL